MPLGQPITPSNPTRVLSFTDHLQELRTRVIICLTFFALSLVVGFFFAPRIVSFLMRPLSTLPVTRQHHVLTLKLESDGSVTWVRPAGTAFDALATSHTLAGVATDAIRVKLPDGMPEVTVGHRSRNHLSYLTPLEPFFLWMQGALLAGAVVSIPMLVYQLWLFIAPGLLGRERKVVAPILAASLLLFPMGAGFAYLMSQVTLKFLLAFGDSITGLEPNLVASKYLSFLMTMMLVFGLVFEFPLVLLLLSQLGIINAAFLVQRRRVAVVVMSIISAVATPSPDPFSMLAMLFPLLLLYEGSIWAIRLLEKRAKPVSEVPADNIANAA